MTVREEYDSLQAQITQWEQRGDYIALESHMGRFLELTGEWYGIDSLQYAATKNDYAGVLRDVGRYTEAEQFFLQAKDAIGRLLGEEHPEYATVINNLAGLYRLMKQYNKAEKYFEQALRIYANTLGRTHFLYISGLNNLGLLYQDMGRFDKAEGLHADSLALLKQQQDNSVAIATTLNNLASARRQQGKTEGVEEMLKEALQIYEEQVGRKHSLYAYGLNNLASYFFSQGEYSAAKQYYWGALEICRMLFGESSQNYQISLRNYELAEQKVSEQRRTI